MSGNGLRTAVIGAVLTSDRFGHANSAYHFDGNSKIIIQDTTVLDIGNSDYSISAWIKLERSDADMRIYSHGSSGCRPGYMFRTSGSKLYQEF